MNNKRKMKKKKRKGFAVESSRFTYTWLCFIAGVTES
jgi:hypothetical protein